MKITEQQFLVMLDVLGDSLRTDDHTTFKLTLQTRTEWYRDIIKSQTGKVGVQKNEKV